tara:strand:+ start:25754 stop:26848 length:1095 start_codon:yes stop_codon:yes gene_type:complete
MKIKDLTNFLEKNAPLNLQEDYDNSGLLIGDKEMDITSALICIDSTEEVIDEAIENGCNLVIAHHPIIFSGIKKLNGKDYIERTIIKAIKNNIAIYAIHTNLDNIIGGVSSKIADIIGLENKKILSPKNNFLRKLEFYVPKKDSKKVLQSLFDIGAGSLGNYKNCSFRINGVGTFLPTKNANPSIGEIGVLEETDEFKIELLYPKNIESKMLKELINVHPYEQVSYQIINIRNSFQEVGTGIVGELIEEMDSTDFLKLLKKKIQTKCIRHTKIVNDRIKKVAVCGGSGSFLLNEAISSGSDIFITSDFKYHDFFNAENNIIIADVGHYESEQFTKELIYDLIINNFSKFAVLLSKVNTNPINYI